MRFFCASNIAPAALARLCCLIVCVFAQHTLAMNAETQRLLQNLAIVGTVDEVNASDKLMRLQVGDNLTNWVTIPTIAAGKVRLWRCPSVGEQFLLVCPSGDLSNAVALMALYSDANPSPSSDPDEIYLRFNDEDFLAIHVTDSTLNLTISDITINAATQITLDTPSVTITGDLQVDGGIHSDGDTVADTVSLKTHTHSGVRSGAASTGIPNP